MKRFALVLAIVVLCSPFLEAGSAISHESEIWDVAVIGAGGGGLASAARRA